MLTGWKKDISVPCWQDKRQFKSSSSSIGVARGAVGASAPETEIAYQARLLSWIFKAARNVCLNIGTETGGGGHVPPNNAVGGRSRECPLQYIWDMFKTTNDFTL